MNRSKLQRILERPEQLWHALHAVSEERLDARDEVQRRQAFARGHDVPAGNEAALQAAQELYDDLDAKYRNLSAQWQQAKRIADAAQAYADSRRGLSTAPTRRDPARTVLSE